jgi:hypothetical protein
MGGKLWVQEITRNYMSYDIAVVYKDMPYKRFRFVSAPIYNDCIEPLAERLSLSLLKTIPSIMVISSQEEMEQLVQELQEILKLQYAECINTYLERIEEVILLLKDLALNWKDIISVRVE